jgi:alpha-D-xyloside xylohydrolase
VSATPRRLLLASAILAAVVAACGDGNEPRPSTGSSVQISGDRIRIISPVVIAEVHRDPYRLQFIERTTGRPITGEIESGGVFYERAGTSQTLTRVRSARAVGQGAELTVDTTEGTQAQVHIRFLTPHTLEVVVDPPASETVSALGDRWDTPDDELIYGLTSRLRDGRSLPNSELEVPIDDVQPQEVGSLNRRGETVDMYVRPTFALYAPFYQSSRGYGLAVAGSTAGAFDIAKTDPHVLAFRFETGNAPESRQLRVHLFYGPEYATILDEYTALTGRPFVPPAWAFLHWRWRDELAIGPPALLDGVPANAQLAEDVTMYDQLGIPPGVYLFDRPVLEGEFGFARFVFDETRLPNVDATMAALRRRGYRILTWSSMWACGSQPGDNGGEAQQLGFLAPGMSGTPMCADMGGGNFILDPTNPAARDWWRGKLRDFVRRYDIDGIKLDRGEEFIPSQATDIWHDGRNGREVRNDYPVLQAQVHHDAMADVRGNDFLVISRSSYTGLQQYALTWSGDVAGSTVFGIGPGTDLGLRSVIISQQRAGFMGLPIWGSDTGGYYEFKDREVFARWIEISAFSGIMEIGGTGAHAPWDMPTEPKYDAEMIDIYRRYTRLRVTLQDYIVAAAQAAEKGMPIVRPLVFAYRDDPTVADLWDQYLFGPDLMVAPVWRIGQRARQVYFPPGTWRSYWNEAERYEGPATVTVDTPLDVIPVYVRGDAEPPRPGQ